MILVIDNYDSFVYNLARYFECFSQLTSVVRNDKIDIKDIEKMNPTHIVISPGPCTPSEAGVSLKVIQHFYNKIPILGVCLGHQAIGQVFGAKISKAKVPMHGKSSKIKHNGTRIFNNLPNNLKVGRYHSLIVNDLPLYGDLDIIATSPENEIMGLAHKKFPLIGVQFHPESILTDYGYKMIENFFRTCL